MRRLACAPWGAVAAAAVPAAASDGPASDAAAGRARTGAGRLAGQAAAAAGTAPTLAPAGVPPAGAGTASVKLAGHTCPPGLQGLRAAAAAAACCAGAPAGAPAAAPLDSQAAASPPRGLCAAAAPDRPGSAAAAPAARPPGPGAAATTGRAGGGEAAGRLGGSAAASPGSRASAVRDARLRCGVRLARGLELSARLAPMAGRAGEVASAGGSCRTGVTAGLRPSACLFRPGCCPTSDGRSDANASCGAVALRGVPSAGPASATAH